MAGTMIKLCQEIDGAFFGYTFSDEIVIISRNDHSIEANQWCSGRIQKIASLSASLATLELSKLTKQRDLEIFGDAVFYAETFVVPNFTEAINTIVLKQQQAFYAAVSNACFYELAKNHNIETVRETISNKSIGEKLDILAEHCQINFDDYYAPFRRGAACYRAPQIIQSHGQEEIRNKLTVDMELPVFSKDRGFLETIFRGGRDILRVK
jgi:tRNA(His) 5'-end guanylyltransferase